MDIPTSPPLVPAVARPEGPEKDGRAAAAADFGSFLTLLTAQMRNQDPLQPMDGTEFIAQLASFSSVEQLVQVNDRLDALASRAMSQQGAGYAGWIGLEASAVDGRFAASGGGEEFWVEPLEGATRIEAVVLAGGQTVDRFTVSADAAGRAEWPNAASSGVAPGTEMRIELVYHGSSGIVDRRPATVFRAVTGLRGTPEGPLLELAGGGTLAPERVAELRDPRPPE